MDSFQVLRIGTVSAVNPSEGTARVTYECRDGCTTAELPMLSWEYRMPKVGDRVVTGHLWGGSAAAVIIGPLWHDGHRPVESGDGLYRKDFAGTQGEAYERYSEATQSLTISAGGVTMTLKDGTMTVNGDMSVSGDLAVTGNLTVGGTIHGEVNGNG